MAKRRKQPKKPSRQRSSPPVPPLLPDRRILEHAMRRELPGITGVQPDPQQAQAMEIMFQAYESEGPAKRVRLAKQALEIWPDCADAYVLLAEHAAAPQEALPLYQEGMAAGRRALGPDEFENAAGHFWGVFDTRP